MFGSNTAGFKAHHSEKTKYYGLLFIAILAVPIGVLLYFMVQGSIIFAAAMSAILLGVIFILAYFTLKSGSLKYEASPRELCVTFGLLKKRVPYNQIVNVQKAELSLSLRLFGASLPGFHWGLFTTSIGRAHVYATKISGEFVVATLADGEKIVLSPEEPDQLVAALQENNVMFSSQTPQEIAVQKQAQKKLVYIQVALVTLAYAVYMGYFFWVYASLPQTVPVHFGFDGVANRWADKSELLWLVGIAAIFPAINAVLTLKFGKYERGMVVLLGAIFVVVIVVFVYSLNMIVAAA
jgi:hypothetical protein